VPGGLSADIMLGNRKLIVDAFCEVREFTKAWQDEEFYNLAEHDIIPGAIYLISRQQFADNIQQIKQLAQHGTILPILGNPAEGSETMLRQMQGLGIVELAQQNRILVITGGYLQPDIPSLYYENFLPKILDYQENLKAISEYADRRSTDRPYKFLFLNGRGRPHRRQLLSELSDLLDQAIWTNLDSATGPVKLLNSDYEFEFYKQNITLQQTGYVKYNLFNNDWGEIYLNPRPYLDTYFSLVTETVFDYPYTFRTEKIWKPIAIGHPFIAVSNAGYYRDLHNLGFRTFGHIIDESFDKIENNYERLCRIITLVKDLCCQDLSAFINESQEVCKYNQQLLAELSPQIRFQFPQQFENFVNERC
jgi:hypothetical protein